MGGRTFPKMDDSRVYTIRGSFKEMELYTTIDRQGKTADRGPKDISFFVSPDRTPSRGYLDLRNSQNGNSIV